MKTFKEIREGMIGDMLAKRKAHKAMAAKLKTQHDAHDKMMNTHHGIANDAEKRGNEDEADHHNGKGHDQSVARDHMANALAAHNKKDYKARDKHIAAWKNHGKASRADIAKFNEDAATDKAVKDFLAKGGKIKKLAPGKAAGYHGKDDPGKGMAGMVDKDDTKAIGTRKKVKSLGEANQTHMFDNEKDARAKAKEIGGKYVKGTGKNTGRHAAIKLGKK